MQMHTCMCVNTYIHLRTHTRTQHHTHAHTRTHAHTHTHPQAQVVVQCFSLSRSVSFFLHSAVYKIFIASSCYFTAVFLSQPCKAHNRLNTKPLQCCHAPSCERNTAGHS